MPSQASGRSAACASWRAASRASSAARQSGLAIWRRSARPIASRSRTSVSSKRCTCPSPPLPASSMCPSRPEDRLSAAPPSRSRWLSRPNRSPNSRASAPPSICRNASGGIGATPSERVLPWPLRRASTCEPPSASRTRAVSRSRAAGWAKIIGLCGWMLNSRSAKAARSTDFPAPFGATSRLIRPGSGSKSSSWRRNGP